MDMNTLPEELKAKVNNLSTFQRNYCEYRAKGLSQALSAQKAGSKAVDKGGLGRVGYQIEQMDGAKEYIEWIRAQRSSLAGIDELEIVHKLRMVYDQALLNNKLSEANKAAELLGTLIGLFGKGGQQIVKKGEEKTTANGVNLEAFKSEEGEEPENETEDRIVTLQKMLVDLNKKEAKGEL